MEQGIHREQKEIPFRCAATSWGFVISMTPCAASAPTSPLSITTGSWRSSPRGTDERIRGTSSPLCSLRLKITRRNSERYFRQSPDALCNVPTGQAFRPKPCTGFRCLLRWIGARLSQHGELFCFFATEFVCKKDSSVERPTSAVEYL